MSTMTIPVPVKRLSQKHCDRWNEANPIGTDVVLTKDLGETLVTKTRSEAWMANGQIAVIFVDGISGYYALSRVRPIPPATPPTRSAKQ